MIVACDTATQYEFGDGSGSGGVELSHKFPIKFDIQTF